MKIFNTTLFLLLFQIGIAQTVSTITEGNFTDGLQIDANGNVYGSQFSGDSVYKYDPNSETVSVFASGFANPNGIGISPNQELYICEHAVGGTGRIFKYDLDGNLLETWDGLTSPTGIKNIPGTNDMLFVTYNNPGTINRLDEAGNISNLFTGAPLNGPAGIAFINDEVFIANFNDRKIYRYDLQTNELTFLAELPSVGPPNTDFLGFLDTKDNKLIATHIGAHQIFQIDPVSGELLSIAGSTAGTNDGPISDARFFQPNGIAGDNNSNRIYVSDAATANLRIIENISLSVSDFNPSIDFEIYPNPVKDLLRIQTNGELASDGEFNIYHTNGSLVYGPQKTDSSLFDGVVSTSTWANGTYFIELISGKRKAVKKFIK